MITTFRTNNEQEAKRLLKSSDMARFIWELMHNGWRKFKHTDYDYEPYKEMIKELLEEYNIKIDELTD